MGDGLTVVIEIAQASGLPLLKDHERNPLIATSFGTGELIRHALDGGYRRFIIGLGGSATNDVGSGLLRALGVKFYNHQHELSFMKPSAILINTARGGIVNEEDLYQALKKGTIWAAGLDVFDEEPVKLDHPLLKLPNVVTLPHIGSAFIQTRTLMAELAASNLLQALAGQVPDHLVNKII